jgi:endonuclease/exonuclease/phosphatase family metal-dependent hydrolase
MIRRVLLLIVVSVSLFGQLPYVAEDFVLNVDQMEKKNKEFQDLLNKNIARFKVYSEAKNFDKAYPLWSDICDEFFYLQLLYYQTVNLSSNLILKGYAGSFVLDLHKVFRQAIVDKNVIEVFENNAFHADLLTPHQRYITKNIIEKTYQPKEACLNALSHFKIQNFKSFEGERALFQTVGNRLKVLTTNILGFPGVLTYFFGGLPQVEDRFEGIKKKLIEVNPDILFLQEVWDREFSKKLVESLKELYPFFAYEAGSLHDTLSPEEIGFNSGLFIASKIPIENLEFLPFESKETSRGGVKRGVFSGTFSKGKKTLKFVATHLQPGTEESDMMIRKLQFIECKKILGKSEGFIIGDLNMNAFSDEFKKNRILKSYQAPYLLSKKEVNEKTSTATDYFNDLTHTPKNKRKSIKPTFEILDYCLAKKNNKTVEILSQEKINMFSVEKPLEALSDHHGVLTVFQLK